MNQAVKALLILGVLLLLAFLGFRLLFSGEPQQVDARVEVVSGQVEIKGEGERDYSTVEGGRDLNSGDSLRTGADGQTRVTIGDDSVVVLEAGSELEVKSLSKARSVFKLRYGQLEADITQFSERILEVEGANPDVRLRTRGGSFAVSSDGFGALSADVRSGEVELIKGDTALRVLGQGESGVVSKGGSAKAWETGSRSMLLKVDWPSAGKVGDTVTLKGETTEGSEVKVGEARVAVDDDGHFEAELPLPESGRLAVESRSLLGSERAESPDLLYVEPTPSPTPEPTEAPPKPPPLNVIHGGDWN